MTAAAAIAFRPPAPTPRTTPLRRVRHGDAASQSARDLDQPAFRGAGRRRPQPARRPRRRQRPRRRSPHLSRQCRQLPEGRHPAPRSQARPRQWLADERRRRLARPAPPAAPLFTPRQVAAFSDAMAQSTRAGVERLARPGPASGSTCRGNGATDARDSEHTLFTSGLSRDTSEFQGAVTRYFNTVGRIDPFDLLGLPDFLPRIGRLRGRATLEWFASAVNDIIAERRWTIAAGEAAIRATFSPCCSKRRIPRRARHGRGRSARQHRHLHRRWPRDDRQRADLDVLPSVSPDWARRSKRRRTANSTPDRSRHCRTACP